MMNFSEKKKRDEVRGLVKLPLDLRRHRWLGKLPGLLCSGQALSESARCEMETFLGYELKDVRIHETWQAGELARRLNADAFTIGRHVFSTESKLSATTAESKGLLAHELCHVIQQTRPNPILSGAFDTESQMVPADMAMAKGIVKSASNLTNIHAPQLLSAGSGAAGGNTSSAALEIEAERAEQMARSSAQNNPADQSLPSAVDVEEIAELVYRKMQTEMIIELDRIRRL